MSNKLIKYKFRNEYFSGYGLNKFKNFLQAPECDCGCDGKGVLLLNGKKDLFGFMNAMLLDNKCGCCAIFAHSYDNKMYAGIKCVEYDEDGEIINDSSEDGTPVKFFTVDDDYYEFFQELDANIGLYCYGLIIETNKGQWKIIED